MTGRNEEREISGGGSRTSPHTSDSTTSPAVAIARQATRRDRSATSPGPSAPPHSPHAHTLTRGCPTGRRKRSATSRGDGQTDDEDRGGPIAPGDTLTDGRAERRSRDLGRSADRVGKAYSMPWLARYSS